MKNRIVYSRFWRNFNSCSVNQIAFCEIMSTGVENAGFPLAAHKPQGGFCCFLVDKPVDNVDNSPGRFGEILHYFNIYVN